jgi:spore coat protein CotH
MSFRLRKPLLSTLLILALGLSSAQSATAAQPVSGISTTVYNEGTDAAAVFYNPVVVSNVDLTMPQATIDALNADPNASTYRTADVKITTADGVITTLTNIGVRLKGQATRRLINNYDKAPMKLKFDAFVAGQKFMGLTRMTLNSMVQDPSFIREDTSYRIYRAMGLVAPRTTYSWVTVNNADFGLYMNVEAIDGQMLKRWLNPVHVYSSNCYLADLTLSQSWCYDTNYGDTNRADLNAAIAVSVYDGATWWTEVNKIADMTSVINLMATDIYTSNWDGYTDVVQNNYYIVFDDTAKLK